METNADIEKARRLLSVLEMRPSKSRVENLIRLVCVQELSENSFEKDNEVSYYF